MTSPALPELQPHPPRAVPPASGAAVPPRPALPLEATDPPDVDRPVPFPVAAPLPEVLPLPKFPAPPLELPAAVVPPPLPPAVAADPPELPPVPEPEANGQPAPTHAADRSSSGCGYVYGV